MYKKRRTASMGNLIALTVLVLFLQELGQSQSAISGKTGAIGLQGTVSSKAEGKMEGVLISAKREGSHITVTVVSDSQGRYVFAAEKLKPGTYQLTTRASGYRPAAARLDVISKKTAQKDIVLEKITDNVELARQLTFSEWTHSVPQTERVFCITCHGLDRIMDKTRDVSAWEKRILLDRNYEIGSVPSKLIYRAHPVSKLSEADKEIAALLSEIAGESKLRGYEFKLLSRPKGRATKVIITQYDLPDPTAAPHSIAVRDGWVWSGNLSGPEVFLLDSRTGEIASFPVPDFRPGFPRGSGDIEVDKEGNAWATLRTQAGVGKVDRRTGKWAFYSIPSDQLRERSRSSMVAPQSLETRGFVWFKENEYNGMYLVDVRTGKVTSFSPFGEAPPPRIQTIRESPGDRTGRGHRAYAMLGDRDGNVYSTDIEGSNIIKVEPTGKTTLFPTPTPDAGPRRGGFDTKGRLWVAGYYANQIEMFDPATGQFQEWKIPKPSEHPYMVMADKNGEVWGAGEWNDYVFRFNRETGEWTQYLLPSINTNIHKVQVDNSTTPVSFWVGEALHGKLTRVEALD